MSLLVALAVGALFAAGLNTMLRRDLFRVVCGTVLITNAAIFAIVALDPVRRQVPRLPVADPALVADPLAQAVALTALVIGFGTSVFLLFVVLAVVRTHTTLDVADLATAEREEREES